MNEWHKINSNEDLPKKKGYYLVAVKGYNDYRTEIIFFRGKSKWATGNSSIKAWMELPKEYTGE